MSKVPMRRKDREVKEFDKIIKIIDKCEIIRLGLADGDYPYIVPVNFSYTVDGVTYEKRSNVGTTAKPFEVGDRLKIRVDPQDHNKYIMIKSKGFDIAFGVLMALAAFFIIATVITAIAVR